MSHQKSLGALAFAFLAVAGLSTAARAEKPKAPASAGMIAPGDIDRNELQLYWQCHLPLGPKEKIVRTARLDDNIYLQSDSGDLYCVQSKVGILRWEIAFALPKDSFWPPSHNPDREDYINRIDALRTRLADAEELRALVLQGVQANPRLSDQIMVYLNKYQPTMSEKLKQLQDEQFIHADGKAINGEVANVRSQYEQELSQLFTYGEIVTLGTQSYGMNLDLRTGQPRTKIEYGFAASCAPASNGVVFFVGGAGGRFYAMSTKIDAVSWEVKSTSATLAHPVYHQDRVFWCDGDGMVMSSNAGRKADTWQVNLGGHVTSDITHTKQGLFIGSTDQAVYRVNDTLGKVTALLRVNGPVRSAPEVTGEYAYFPVTDVGFHIARLPNLDLACIRPDITAFAVQPDKKFAYLLTKSGKLDKVSLPDGKTLDSMALPSGTTVISNSQGSSLFLLRPDGLLECYRPQTVPFLKVSDVDQVPDLSVVYTKVTENAVFMAGSSDMQRDLQDLLRPEPRVNLKQPRTDWLASHDRNLPASGVIDRAAATGQPGAGGAAAPKPAAP